MASSWSFILQLTTVSHPSQPQSRHYNHYTSSSPSLTSSCQLPVNARLNQRYFLPSGSSQRFARIVRNILLWLLHKTHKTGTVPRKPRTETLHIARATESIQGIVLPLLFVSGVNAALYRDWGRVRRSGKWGSIPGREWDFPVLRVRAGLHAMVLLYRR